MTAVFSLTFLLIIIAGSYISFAENCALIREDSIRLHIIANSDSEEDQELKLKLRDEMLIKFSGKLAQGDPVMAAKTARSLSAEMQTEAERFIRSQGFDYPVKVSLVDMYFNTTEYETFTMPAGRYKALRFEIGSASGKNWWCVMYPPLCIPAAGEEEAQEITDRIESLNSSVTYKPAFAVVEAVEKLKLIFEEGESASKV